MICVVDTNRRRHNRREFGSARLLLSVFVESAFVFGLCAAMISIASASVTPSTPRFYNDYERNFGNKRGVKKVDDSEDEANYDYDHAPWQPNPSNLQNIDEAIRYEDMPPTVFSPTGRLHPVEAAVRASKSITPLSNILVAMRCRDGLLVISTFPVSPHVDAKITTTTIDANTSRTNMTANTGDNSDDTIGPAQNETSSSTADSDGSAHPSLFLFHETSTSATTGPIFDMHPCIVGATAGNAVDNRIMRAKLLALGLNALENQGAIEEDVTTGRVAKDLANQLQVVTQDIAAAQKQKLGRILASSAVILGSKKIWRVDPTGQFWDCQATVLGADADRTEEEFYHRLLEKCKDSDSKNIRELLSSISQDEALELVEDFLRHRLDTQQNLRPLQFSATPKSNSGTETSAKKSGDPSVSQVSSQICWQAVILDYSSMTKRGTPRRRTKRGIFGFRSKF